MPRYRVTLRRTTVEIVEAPNPYQAAVIASARGGDGVEIASVTPAVGRPTASGGPRKTVKKAAKKRRPLSPEARAKLAQNLVKARAARAAKRKGTQRAVAKKARPVKKAKRAVKKR